MSGTRLALCASIASLLLAGGITAAGRSAPVILLGGDDLEIVRLEDRIWLYTATIEWNGSPVASNGLVIAGSGGAIVIDTPWNDELTARLLDWAGSSFGEIAAVVGTHFHADRLGGIAEVHRRGLASYGHAETARLALENGLEPPGSTFDDELILSSGDRIVEIFFPGPGHSPDNTVVWLAEERLLFGGCMVKSAASTGLGNLADAVIEGWPGSLEALLGRYPTARVVVPGHGAAAGLDAVRHTLELVRQHLAREPAAAAPNADSEPRAEPGEKLPAEGSGGA